MKKIIVIAIFALFLSACGSSNQRENARVKNIEVSNDAKVALADKSSDEKVICKQIRKTGSNRITTVCQSESEMKAIREATQRELRRKPQSGPSGESGGR
jgi:uncharacterized protein YcfL